MSQANINQFCGGARKVAETPIHGLYEIMTETDVFYQSEGGYTFYGDLRDPDGRSLTADALKSVSAARIERLPFDAAIKVGSGAIRLIEFVNPFCPHCRNLHAYLSKIPDITRYIFLSGISETELNWDTLAGAALQAGQPLPFRKKDLLSIHRSAYLAMGIKAVPAVWIGSTYVIGTDIEKIESELEKARVQL